LLDPHAGEEMTTAEEDRVVVIAWVDHDKQSVAEVVDLIGSLRRNERDRKCLRDVFRFVPVLVPPGDDLAGHARDAILTQCGRPPDIILVDLTYGHEQSEADIGTGRDLASELRRLLSPIPVGVYTRYELQRLNRVLISSDAFAVVLEQVRDSCEGPSRLTGDQWCNLFQKIIDYRSESERSRRRDDAAAGLSVVEQLGSGLTTVSEVRGKVDVAIISIREDEFDAILSRFPDRRRVQGRRLYDFSVVRTRTSNLGVVIVRCLEQGQGTAQAVAGDLIEDVSPRWIFLVGIAGGIPDVEYTLGDVILGSRLNDFSVNAAFQDGSREFNVSGGGMHKDVENLLAHLPAMSKDLGKWNLQDNICLKKPTVLVPKDCSGSQLYGDDAWKQKVLASLANGFPSGKRPRAPKFLSRPVISANTLLKDVALAREWQTVARHVAAVEMELGGVYLAARSCGDRDCRILSVRGISDIVGYKRSPEWTAYACQSAASFAHALIVSGIIEPKCER
jgi:nucleoside phosphorylase